MTDWGIVAGVILLIIAIVGVISLASILDSRSKRERGIPREEKKRTRGKREK